jgi:hypothetical protein
LGTGFFFYNDDPKKYDISTYAQPKGGGLFVEYVDYPKKDLVSDQYAKQVISTWKKWVAEK